jgi:hypothetical protein
MTVVLFWDRFTFAPYRSAASIGSQSGGVRNIRGIRGVYLSEDWRGDEVSVVVHFAGDLLAAGIAGADFVSVGVVDSAAVSDRGDRSGGSARLVEGNIVFARQDLARAEDGVVAARIDNPPQRLKNRRHSTSP